MSPTSRSSFRVLIVEDHALFAESLDLALTLEGYDVRRFEPDEVQVSPTQLVRSVLRIAPRVVLLDLDLGGFGDAAQVIRPLAEAGMNVVVVSAAADPSRQGECLWLGARRVIPKTRPLNEISSVVRRLHLGLPVLTAHDRETLIATWREDRSGTQELTSRLARLTPREQQVLGMLMRGALVRDIARGSVVSEATVRTQVKAILAKLEVSSQISAVGLAHRVGWRAPAPVEAAPEVRAGLRQASTSGR